MKIKNLFICVFLAAGCASTNTVPNIPTFGDSSTELIVNWDVGSTNIICKYSGPQKPYTGGNDVSLKYALTFYKVIDGNLTKFDEVDVYETVLSIYPLRMFASQNTNRLLVVTSGPSNIRETIFQFKDGKITDISGGTSNKAPEILYDSNGDEMILLTEVEHVIDGNESTDAFKTIILKWNGQKYLQYGPFPEGMRLDKAKELLKK